MALQIMSIISVCNNADSIQALVVRVAPSCQTGSGNKLMRGSEGGLVGVQCPSLAWAPLFLWVAHLGGWPKLPHPHMSSPVRRFFEAFSFFSPAAQLSTFSLPIASPNPLDMNIKGAGLSARNRTIFRLPTGQSMASSSFRRTIVRRERQTRPFFVLFFSGCGKCPRGHAISIDGFSHLASNNQHQDGDGPSFSPTIAGWQRRLGNGHMIRNVFGLRQLDRADSMIQMLKNSSTNEDSQLRE